MHCKYNTLTMRAQQLCEILTNIFTRGRMEQSYLIGFPAEGKVGRN
jgi:c-di-GMP-related signal transduction protein